MKKYAVIGNPIHQSWSPFIHQQFAKQTHIDLSYETLKLDCPTQTIPIGLQDVKSDASVRVLKSDGYSFKQAIKQLFMRGYSGLNITLPYKIWAFELIQEKNGLSARAEKSGAVNTITFINQDTWLGDNTDGIGLVRDLKNNLGWPIKKTNILILGAGGAARGAIAALANEKPACIHILNRDPSKAKNLAKIFSGDGCEIRNINPPLKLTYPLIINATSSSLWQQLPSTIQHLDTRNAYCYDMVYMALPTIFLKWAIEKKANATSDGLGMLVEQAAESFYQWHNVMPTTHPVIQQLRTCSKT